MKFWLNILNVDLIFQFQIFSGKVSQIFFAWIKFLSSRTYSSFFMHVIVTHTRLYFKISSNFVHFCPNFQIFCPLLSFFCPFLKNHTYTLTFYKRVRQESCSRNIVISVTIQATFPQSFRKHYSEAKTIIDCGSFHINLTWPCNGVLTPLIKHTSYQNGNP